ncbi:hypothetical protein OROGR_000193 [Orobanche gracilis]
MMTDEGREENVPRGNEWEVVTLTASAYAAAPGPKQVDPSEDIQNKFDVKHDAETSSAMFMSRHFVFPPNQPENLPLESEYKEIHREKVIEDVSRLVQEEGGKSDMKDEENPAFKPDEFPGNPIFDDKGNSLVVGGADFGKDETFETAQSIYSSVEFSSFHCETTMGKMNNIEEGEGADDSTEPADDDLGSDLHDFQKSVEGDGRDPVDLPCEAWWRRRAISLYTHAKEANTFWSIFIAAAVMGLVIIGHQWQQERWKVLHLKLHFGITDERMGRMLGPISRFKDVIVGGHRRGSLVRGGSSVER